MPALFASALQHLSQDARFALRQLRRTPTFALTAVLTLALSIGATSAVFALLRATLLLPIPYPHPTRLVGIGFVSPTEPPEAEQTGETADLLLRQSRSYSSLGITDGGASGQNLSFTGANNTVTSQPVRSLRVSSGYLPTLGVAPLLGHTFTQQDDTPGAAPTVVLSQALWRRLFGADPQIVGKSLHLNDDLFTIIGVMPSSLATVDSPDLWQPLKLSPADPGYGGDNYQCIARLKPSSSLAQAAAELTALDPEIFRQFPRYSRWSMPGSPRPTLRLWPLQQVLVQQSRPSLLALAAAVGAILFLACLNLAGLLTARALARRQELAIRSALGATRLASLRLLLTESALLALAGSCTGVALAYLALPIFLRYAPLDLPQLHRIAIDPPVFLFTVALACTVTLLITLLPAMGLLRRSAESDLSRTRSTSTSSLHQRLGPPLLFAQVMLAMLLLSTGGMLLTTFLHLRSIPSGVAPHGLFALQVNMKGTKFHTSAHTLQFLNSVEDGLRGMPGVSNVAAVNGLPLDRGLNNSGGPANDPDHTMHVETRFVTPGYFTTVGHTLLLGADIASSDNANSPSVALINQRAAQQWFPNRSALGESILDLGRVRRVIGVVADVHNRSLAEAPQRTVYVPFAQASDAEIAMVNGWFPTTFLLRSNSASKAAGAALLRTASAALASVDADVPVSSFLPMDSVIERTVAAPRFFSWLVGCFGLFALLLTILGLFGLLSYQVSSRTREIGVRMALGSSRARVLRLVLTNALTFTALGVLAGSLAALAARQPLLNTLANATRTDPRELAPLLGGQTTPTLAAFLALLVAAALASFLPARRAASIDPNTALRTE